MKGPWIDPCCTPIFVIEPIRRLLWPHKTVWTIDLSTRQLTDDLLTLGFLCHTRRNWIYLKNFSSVSYFLLYTKGISPNYLVRIFFKSSYFFIFGWHCQKRPVALQRIALFYVHRLINVNFRHVGNAIAHKMLNTLTRTCTSRRWMQIKYAVWA